MPGIKRFEELEAWQTARLLTRRVYEITRQPPLARDYALCDQLRRAATSIMSNIAEGHESGEAAQYLRYLAYAKGSAGEVRAQLYVALDVDYLSQEVFSELCALAERCSRQIHGLMSYLRSYRESHHLSETGHDYEITPWLEPLEPPAPDG